jgi:hypothetical protein
VWESRTRPVFYSKRRQQKSRRRFLYPAVCLNNLLLKKQNKLWVTSISASSNLPDQIEIPKYFLQEFEDSIKCFVLYIKYPKNRWLNIKKAKAILENGI